MSHPNLLLPLKVVSFKLLLIPLGDDSLSRNSKPEKSVNSSKGDRPSRKSSSDSLLGIAESFRSSRSGGSSPRFDPQDLAYLQQQMNPKDDSAKQSLLKGIDIVQSFIPKSV